MFGIAQSSLFLGYVLGVAILVAFVLARYLPSQRAILIALGTLVIWLVYSGALGYLGIVARPFGLFVLLGPIMLSAVVVLIGSPVGRLVAMSVPIWVLIGLQTARLGVELTLLALHQAGRVPQVLTLEGGNIDIVVGATAPIVAWLATRGTLGRRVAMGWSILGLASLLNVATRALLTAPGPLHLIMTDVPNEALGTFPYTFIPGFIAPLALMLHVLTIRVLRRASVVPHPGAARAAMLVSK